MSLDVYLTMPGTMPEAAEGIFVREGGSVREVSRSEWEERFHEHAFPNCYSGPTVFDADKRVPKELYSANITHNLGTMAEAAGIYIALWRPEEGGFMKAGQLIEPLKVGLALLQSDPVRFSAFNPENGWGDYDGLVRFTASYLSMCEEYPDADVSVSR